MFWCYHDHNYSDEDGMKTSVVRLTITAEVMV